MRCRLPVTILLLTCAATPAAVNEDTMKQSIKELRIAECEWIAFETDRGRPMSAVRVVAQDGAEGAWVGDAMRGMDKSKATEFLAALKGMDVSDPEAAWDRLVEKSLPPALLKAVDVALWDLYGRARGKPVGKLLGPLRRDKVKLYIAGFPNMTAEENAEAVKQAAGRNIKGYKVYTYLEGRGEMRDPSDAVSAEKWLTSDIQIARDVRVAAPKDMSLMFYNGLSYDLDKATKMGKVLDELRYALYFDPMPVKGEEALSDYKRLSETIRTRVCGPISAGPSVRMQWLEKEAVDVYEIDLYAGFTPCLRFARACAKKGVQLDLHGGFPMDTYHFPLYGFVGDEVLPWIGWHSRSPKWVPVAKKPSGSEDRPKRMPWLKRIQARPVDADGYVRILYEIPGMGIEPDWDWIRKQETVLSKDKRGD